MPSENEISYTQFLEVIKIEFSDFLRTAEQGSAVRHASLRARKKSIKLREILKKFREVALRNDRRIAQIMSEARERVRMENQ